MLKRTYKPTSEKQNNHIIRALNFIYECVFSAAQNYFSAQYLLVLDSVIYSNKKECYTIILRFKNSSQTLTLETREFFKDKKLINLISPIDAYFLGIILGLESNYIVLGDCERVSNYFKQFNQFSSVKPLVKITDIQVSDSSDSVTVKTNFSTKHTKIPILDISKKPFLLQAFSNNDALYLGMNSLDFFIHNHNNATIQ